MAIGLAAELYRSGSAHAGAACLLYRASVEHAEDEKIEDPISYAFNGPNSLSLHYLLGLGLELMLKATIVATDPDVDATYLRSNIGHDLVAALDEAEQRGFQSEAPYLRDVVELLREPFKQHWFRYERPDQIPLPGDFDQIVQLLTVLDAEVEAAVQANGEDNKQTQ